MRPDKTYRNFLLATTVLALTIPAGHAAAQEAETTGATQSAQGLQIEGQPLITTGEAVLQLDVVNPEGEALGNLADFIIDFSKGEVQYVLLADNGDEEAQEHAADDQAGDDSGDAEDMAADDQAADDQAADDQAADDQAEEGEQQAAEATAERRVYPIPIQAFKLSERPDDTQEMAAAEEQETAEAEAEPEAEAEGETAETEQVEDHPLYALQVDEITGTDVYNLNGDEIATVREVILDRRDGDVRAVLGVGGFLGIGEKHVAIPLRDFEPAHDNGYFTLTLTTDELDEMPAAEHTDDDVLDSDVRPVDVVTREADTQEDTAREADEAEPEMAEDEAEPAEMEEDADRAEAEADAEPRDNGDAAAVAEDQPYDLENMVLVIDISSDQLKNAPSFVEGEFPDVQDQQWHDAILAFYSELLGAEQLGLNGHSDEPTEHAPEIDEEGEAE